MAELLFLSRQEINLLAYDTCVETAPNGLIYGLSWWLDIVSPNWACLALPDGSNGYAAVLPIPQKKRFGIAFIDQPLFAQFLDIFSVKSLSEKEISAFFITIQKKYRLVAKYFIVTQPIGFEGNITKRFNLELPLSPTYAHLRESYNRDRRMNLIRAEKQSWESVSGTEISSLGKLFADNHAHQVQGGAAPNTYSLLEQLFAACEARQLSDLQYVTRNNTPVAGAWFVTWKNRVIYIFNAADATGRKGNGRTFLIDNFLKKHAESDLIFDFEGPEIPEIAGFYGSFGSKPVAYYELRANNLPAWFNALWSFKKWLKR